MYSTHAMKHGMSTVPMYSTHAMKHGMGTVPRDRLHATLYGNGSKLPWSLRSLYSPPSRG